MNFYAKKSPVRDHRFVIELAELEPKLDANRRTLTPKQEWWCRICQQPRIPLILRGTGFKPDTASTDHARTEAVD
jgi:hypothetical protein